MSLLRKLTLVIVGVGIPALLLYMGSALWFARHGVRESVSTQQLEFAHQALDALDREIDAVYRGRRSSCRVSGYQHCYRQPLQ
jgi:hypothetical protein